MNLLGGFVLWAGFGLSAFLLGLYLGWRAGFADGNEERCGREDAEKIAATAAERKP